MSTTINNTLAWRTALLTLLFSWPVLVFGHPSYIPDSASYFKGGAAAVDFVSTKIFGPGAAQLDNGAPRSAFKSGPSASSSAVENPKAVRSIAYSVAAYELRWPGIDMTALALLQMVCSAFLVAVVAGVSGITSPGRYLVLCGIVAFATPLAPLCATICPDVFAGLAIAGIILFVTARRLMSPGVRLVVAAIVAFAVASHASIPPIAVGMAVLGAVALLASRGRPPGVSAADWGWLTLPPLAGIAITVFSGFVAFGDVSVAPKRFPLALNRSIVDGPARWYLQKHCVVPEYAVCEVFGTKIPVGTNEFLFDDTGLKGRATPAQMDRIRAEEATIVMRAAMAYPGTELYMIMNKTARQMIRFAPANTQFRTRIGMNVRGVVEVAETSGTVPLVIRLIQWTTLIAVGASMAWLVLKARTLGRHIAGQTLLVFAGLAGNAFVCVAFSSLSDRYQERVIWLLPLFVSAIALGRYRQTLARPPAPDALSQATAVSQGAGAAT